MDKHILSLYDDTEAAGADAAPDTIGALHTEPWQAGPRRWRGWPVLGIGALALAVIAGMNYAVQDAAPKTPADVVAAAPQAPLPAPSIDRSMPTDPEAGPAVDKPVDSPVDKTVGKLVDKPAEAAPMPKAAPAPKPKPADPPAPRPKPREPALPEPASPPDQLSAPLSPPAAQPDPPQVLPQPVSPAQVPALPAPPVTSGE